MPHPERNVSGQAPAGRQDGAGLTIFTNAVRMVRGCYGTKSVVLSPQAKNLVDAAYGEMRKFVPPA